MAENPDPFNYPNNIPPNSGAPVNPPIGPRTRRYQIIAMISFVSFLIMFIFVFLFIFNIVPEEDMSFFWFIPPILCCCNIGSGQRRQQERRRALEREMGINPNQNRSIAAQKPIHNADEDICSNCDQPIEPNVRFCPHCGAQIPGR